MSYICQQGTLEKSCSSVTHNKQAVLEPTFAPLKKTPHTKLKFVRGVLTSSADLAQSHHIRSSGT